MFVDSFAKKSRNGYKWWAAQRHGCYLAGKPPRVLLYSRVLFTANYIAYSTILYCIILYYIVYIYLSNCIVILNMFGPVFRFQLYQLALTTNIWVKYRLQTGTSWYDFTPEVTVLVGKPGLNWAGSLISPGLLKGCWSGSIVILFMWFHWRRS